MKKLIAIMAGMALGFCTSAQATESVRIDYEMVSQERVFDAVVEAVKQSTVSAQLVGRVIEVNYDVDDFVAKDAVLVRFRDSEQQARFQQAEAALKEAQARLDESEKEYRRVEDIYAKKLVPKADMDRAEAGRASARARVDAAQAKLAEAREQLSHTVVKAPFAGYVTERYVEVGETVNVGQALMKGFSYQNLRATTHIPQAFVAAVREFGQARVLLVDGWAVPSDAMRVFPYADPRSHAFEVRVSFSSPERVIYPGMFVKVAFVTGQAQQLRVPASAVVHRSELTALYVLKDGALSLRQVRVGRLLDDRYEILAGLEAGEEVALDPIAAGIQLKQGR